MVTCHPMHHDSSEAGSNGENSIEMPKACENLCQATQNQNHQLTAAGMLVICFILVAWCIVPIARICVLFIAHPTSHTNMLKRGPRTARSILRNTDLCPRTSNPPLPTVPLTVALAVSPQRGHLRRKRDLRSSLQHHADLVHHICAANMTTSW
jgi:hypothetical protein